MVLKTNADDRLGVLDGALHFGAAIHLPGDRLVFGGRREIFNYEVHQQVGADIVQRRAAQHGIDAALADRLAEAIHDMFHRQRPLVEELLQ